MTWAHPNPLASAGCTPRAAAGGKIKDARFETSLDGENLDAAGRGHLRANDLTPKSVKLDGSLRRYVRMTGVMSFEGKWVGCGEFTATTAAPAAVTKPVITSPAAADSLNEGSLAISGTADSGASITVFDGSGAVLQTATASAAGAWSVTTPALTAGTYKLLAVASAGEPPGRHQR